MTPVLGVCARGLVASIISHAASGNNSRRVITSYLPSPTSYLLSPFSFLLPPFFHPLPLCFFSPTTTPPIAKATGVVAFLFLGVLLRRNFHEHPGYSSLRGPRPG